LRKSERPSDAKTIAVSCSLEKKSSLFAGQAKNLEGNSYTS